MKLKDIRPFLFKNIGRRQTIIKNAFWLMFSEIIPKGVLSFLVILIVRYLGAEDFGRFNFAFVFVSFFAVITDFGLIPLTIRSVAQNSLLVKKYVDNIVVIKFVLSFLSFFSIMAVLSFLDKSSQMKSIIYLAGIWMVVQSFIQFFQAIFRAFEQMEYETFSKIIYSAVLFAAVFLAIYFNLGIIFLVRGYILASFASLVVTLLLIRKKFTKFWMEIDFVFWKDLFKQVWPFAIFSILTVIYSQIAIIMLSVLKTNIEVGLYSVAFNSVVVFLILADIVASSALPALSKIVNEKAFGNLSKKLILILFLAGIFLAVILFFSADPLLKLIFGREFARSVLAFKIMVWILPLRFMNYLFGVSLIAADLQKKRLTAATICAIFSIVANLILIPYFGLLGAAVATLLTEIVLFFFYFVFYKKAASTNTDNKRANLLRPLPN